MFLRILTLLLFLTGLVGTIRSSEDDQVYSSSNSDIYVDLSISNKIIDPDGSGVRRRFVNMGEVVSIGDRRMQYCLSKWLASWPTDHCVQR